MPKALFASFIHAVGDYLKGFFLYGMLDGVYAEKRCLDNLFMAGLFGTCIGFPFLFNYYHLRLMPHYMMRLDLWRKRVLRERDFFDHIKD